jgi:hypothetical protein
MALIDQGYKNEDYARTGVNKMFGFLSIWVQTASHLSQLNVIVAPMVRQYTPRPIGIG